MRIGVTFPQTEIGADPGAVRELVQATEDLGYDCLKVYDDVVGADIQHYQGWDGGCVNSGVNVIRRRPSLP